MNQIKANFTFLLHKGIALSVVMAIALFVQYHAPSGWGQGAIIVFFIVSQGSFYLGILTNTSFNGYGVYEGVNRLTGVTIVPDFGLAWRGFALKPLVHSWTVSFVLNTSFIGVAMFFIRSKGEETRAFGEWTSIFMAYALAKLVALVGEIYVWMMADRRRHWYLTERRLRQLLLDEKWSERSIDVAIERARKDHLLST